MAIQPDHRVYGSAGRNSIRVASSRHPITPAAAPLPSVGTFGVAEVAARTLLDKVHDQIVRPDASAEVAMADLHSGLWSIRSACTEEDWETVVSRCVAHPIAKVLWQDPFTAHGYNKPRGYSGDAALLDYLYGLMTCPPGTSAAGIKVFGQLMNLQAALSVRSRAQILARMIDETAAHFESPRILSIACGHLREAGQSRAIREGKVGEFVALDQDETSLAEVERTVGRQGVKTVHHSVRDILAGKVDLQGFHFVYAAGLYDYLSERVAMRLTRLMFDMLVPNGRLLIANFAPTLPEVAYMEAFMDWKLIYRTPDEMSVLSDDISGDAWDSHRLFWDAHGNIIFLDVTRRGVAAPPTRESGRFDLAGVTATGRRRVKAGPALTRRGKATGASVPT